MAPSPWAQRELHAGAGQIGQRIAERRVFPIDDRDQPAGVPEDVAGPEVAVKQGRRGRRPVRRSCAERLPDPLSERALGQVFERTLTRVLPFRQLRQLRQVGPIEVQRVQRGEKFGHLAQSAGELAVGDGGRSFDVLHDEAGSGEQLAGVVEMERLGRGHSQAPQRSMQRELGRRDVVVEALPLGSTVAATHDAPDGSGGRDLQTVHARRHATPKRSDSEQSPRQAPPGPPAR